MVVETMTAVVRPATVMGKVKAQAAVARAAMTQMATAPTRPRQTGGQGRRQVALHRAAPPIAALALRVEIARIPHRAHKAVLRLTPVRPMPVRALAARTTRRQRRGGVA